MTTKAETKISWADYTFNPWIGCMKVTDGCKNCYAETQNKRFAGGKNWGPDSERRITSVQNWNQVLRLNRECKTLNIRKVVFCASLADVFEDNEQVFEARLRLWDMIEQCDSLDWLLLTKRPQNIRRFIPESWKKQWPSNVMPGVSVCSNKDTVLWDNMQSTMHELKAHYFISMEPLLSEISLNDWWYKPYSIITGGESGPGARPMHPEWVRKLRDGCKEHDIVFHFKQWGEWAEYCKDLDEGGHKNMYILPSPVTVDQGENKTIDLTEQAAHMVRYGVKNTGNRLDGEHYMPKIFHQKTPPDFKINHVSY